MQDWSLLQCYRDRQSHRSDNDEDLAWFQFRKLKNKSFILWKNLTKVKSVLGYSIQTFLPFTPWSQSCRFQWTCLSVAHNTNNRSTLHLFQFNQQKLLSGGLNRRILCSPGICVISFAFISYIIYTHCR